PGLVFDTKQIRVARKNKNRLEKKFRTDCAGISGSSCRISPGKTVAIAICIFAIRIIPRAPSEKVIAVICAEVYVIFLRKAIVQFYIKIVKLITFVSTTIRIARVSCQKLRYSKCRVAAGEN